MKFFSIVLSAAMLFLVACENKQQNPEQQAEINNQQQEINQLNNLIDQVDDKLSEIERINTLIIGLPDTREGRSQRAQLLERIEAIKTSIDGYIAEIDQLEQRLSESDRLNGELRKLIERQRRQISDKEEFLTALEGQLNDVIAENKRYVAANDSLNTAIKQADEKVAIKEVENQQLADDNTQLVNEINICYYAFGSGKTLKDHNIVSSGFLRKTKVMPQNFDKKLFTQADKRTLNEIHVNGKKAEVLTAQPADSYVIVENGKDRHTLKITDKARFWSTTNFLVIKTD